MSTIESSLGEFLFGRTRLHILALLFGPGQRPLHIREIARQANLSVGNTRRELNALAEFGLLLRFPQGHQVSFAANPRHPSYGALQILLRQITGLVPALKQALSPLAAKIQFAFVYGSVARVAERADSDVDLMVIGDLSLNDLVEHLGQTERDIGRPINPTLYSVAEFQSKLTAGNHFLRAVLQTKILMLLGDEDEFRRLG